jgi:hypothetical protein
MFYSVEKEKGETRVPPLLGPVCLIIHTRGVQSIPQDTQRTQGIGVIRAVHRNT